MKIKRRDYLLQMGAGAAGLLATGSPLFSTHAAAQYIETRGLRWPIINTLPLTSTPPYQPQAFVTAIYRGLSQFAYDDERFVEVAFHRGNDKHMLKIEIYKDPVYPYRSCAPESPPRVEPNDRFTLKVAGQRYPDPNVFQKDCNPFNRNNATDTYKNDFRWLPDFHGHDFYPEGYELNHVTGPRVEVHTGTFYTRVRSNSTFKIVDATTILGDCEDEVYDFGHIALYMATAINTTTENVFLYRNDDPNPVYTFAKGHTYQIVFNNECRSCMHHDPDDCDEKKRNDFHFNRKVCKVPVTTRKYGLRVKRRCGGSCAQPDFCTAAIMKYEEITASDEAPCSGAGYGKAPGIP